MSIQLDTNQQAIDDGVMLANTSRALLSERTVLDTLQRIVDVSIATVHGCDGASVSFVQDETVVTPVWTDGTILEVDTFQYASGEGPCLDAIAHGTMFYASDLSSDARWSVFGPQAAKHGLHSLLSFHLGTDRTLGSLNLYARDRGAYDTASRAGAQAFAIHASNALVASDVLETTTRGWSEEARRFDRLEQALPLRHTVALAQGMLMQRGGIDALEAFTLIRQASLDLRLTVAAVAQQIVETGHLPIGPGDVHQLAMKSA